MPLIPPVSHQDLEAPQAGEHRQGSHAALACRPCRAPAQPCLGHIVQAYAAVGGRCGAHGSVIRQAGMGGAPGLGELRQGGAGGLKPLRATGARNSIQGRSAQALACRTQCSQNCLDNAGDMYSGRCGLGAPAATLRRPM